MLHTTPLTYSLLQLRVLKERLQELLDGERDTACEGYSDVHKVAQQQPTMPLPSAVREDVTVNSLVSTLACHRRWICTSVCTCTVRCIILLHVCVTVQCVSML